jgi:hypothetical protein
MNRRKNTSAHTINGQFAPRTIEMLRSPAMRALSLTGRRILDRVEIELASHGGKDNGQLPVTHTDLVEFGIHDHAIGPGLREVETLGFVEIKRGRAGNAEFRRPNLFRLTYRPTEHKRETNEWRQIGSIAQAKKLLGKGAPSVDEKPMEGSAQEKIFNGGNRQRNLLAETAREAA